MLTNLHVRNLALIEESEINFADGLNILTGETGAGKSIVLGSINLALGGKVSTDLIRKGAEYALTELSFHIEDPERIHTLKEMGIEELDHGEVIISRKIMPNRSQFKVNGQSFTAGQVKAMAGILIDIHGQHDNQLLLNERKHLDMVDAFDHVYISPIKQKLAEAYAVYEDTKKKLSSMDTDAESRNREISFMEYEVNEINAAELIDGEDDELEAAFKKMSNAQKIREEMAVVDQSIVSGEDNACSFVSAAIRAIHSAAAYDDSLVKLADTLNDVESILGDASLMISDYLQDSEFDEQDYIETQNRLDQINALKMKYGKTISEINDYCASRQSKLESLYDYDNVIQKLNLQLKEQESVVAKICSELSETRKKAAKELCARIIKALKELNFLDVKFETLFEETNYSANGNDFMRFLISTNPGEDLKPLSKIASGGELSRIMLAIKTVIADQDHIGTMIFDEIDAGISGKTAQLVANKLSELSDSHQIICITHLPQIASMSDIHFKIEKSVMDNKTTTRIYHLDEENTIEELARLLGGSEISDAAINNAKEMRKQAFYYKNK